MAAATDHRQSSGGEDFPAGGLIENRDACGSAEDSRDRWLQHRAGHLMAGPTNAHWRGGLLVTGL